MAPDDLQHSSNRGDTPAPRRRDLLPRTRSPALWSRGHRQEPRHKRRPHNPNGRAELSEEEPDYVYAVPVSPPNSPARVVEAGKSYESTQETLETLGTALAAGVGVVLLVAIAGAYFLARTALRP